MCSYSGWTVDPSIAGSIPIGDQSKSGLFEFLNRSLISPLLKIIKIDLKKSLQKYFFNF
jgi:hypothetical protein